LLSIPSRQNTIAIAFQTQALRLLQLRLAHHIVNTANIVIRPSVRGLLSQIPLTAAAAGFGRADRTGRDCAFLARAARA
jgi:hypothetical protein